MQLIRAVDYEHEVLVQSESHDKRSQGGLGTVGCIRPTGWTGSLRVWRAGYKSYIPNSIVGNKMGKRNQGVKSGHENIVCSIEPQASVPA
jgi:hypothetical protein